MENKTKVGTTLLTAAGVKLNGQAMVDIEGKNAFDAVRDTLKYNCNYGAENASIKAYSEMTQADWDVWNGTFTTTDTTISSLMDYINTIPGNSVNNLIKTIPVGEQFIVNSYNKHVSSVNSLNVKTPNNAYVTMGLLKKNDASPSNVLGKTIYTSRNMHNLVYSVTAYGLGGRITSVLKIYNEGSELYSGSLSVPPGSVEGYDVYICPTAGTVELYDSIPYDSTTCAEASEAPFNKRIPIGSVVILGTITVPSDRHLTWEDIIAGGIVIIPGKPPVGPDVQPPVWCNTNKELLLWAIGQKIRGNNPILPPGMIPTGDTETALHELMEVTNG